MPSKKHKQEEIIGKLREVDDPPAHDTMNGRDRIALNRCASSNDLRQSVA